MRMAGQKLLGKENIYIYIYTYICLISRSRRQYLHPNLCTLEPFWVSSRAWSPINAILSLMLMWCHWCETVCVCVCCDVLTQKKAITTLLSHFQLRIPVEKVLPCGHPAVNEFFAPSFFTVSLPHPHPVIQPSTCYLCSLEDAGHYYQFDITFFCWMMLVC